MVLFWAPSVIETCSMAIPHSVMLLVSTVVMLLAAFSWIVHPWMVTQSAPIILKTASVTEPTVCGAKAVMVLELPVRITGFKELEELSTMEPAPPIM